MANSQEATTFVGTLQGSGCRFAIVVSRFNETIVERLLSGARDILVRHGVSASAIDVAWVPGAFEIPQVALRLARSAKYDGIICLGAVIRGSTPHFDYVCGNAATGIGRVAWDTGVAVGFGVLTCDTVEQAADRAGGKAGNKGSDAALAALEMVQLLRMLPKEAK